MSAGAILSMDFGGRRIGLARCDPTRTLVSPAGVFRRGDSSKDRDRIGAIIDDHEVELIVVGLPLNMDGTEGEQVCAVRSDALSLLGGRKEQIIFWDERLTTFEAERRAIDHKKGDDAGAAAVLLEDFLATSEELWCE